MSRARPQHQPRDTERCEYAAGLHAMGLTLKDVAVELAVSPKRARMLADHHLRRLRMQQYFEGKKL